MRIDINTQWTIHREYVNQVAALGANVAIEDRTVSVSFPSGVDALIASMIVARAGEIGDGWKGEADIFVDGGTIFYIRSLD
jgi:hypothetical protein